MTITLPFEVMTTDATPEQVYDIAVTALTICANAPGVAGRLRTTRIIANGHTPADYDACIRIGKIDTIDAPQADVLRVIDAMIKERLIAQTPGIRPVLVLTRKGLELLQEVENND